MTNVDGIPILVTTELASAPVYIAGQRDLVVEDLNSLQSRLLPLADSWTLSTAATLYQDAEQKWNTAALALFGEEGILDQIVQALNINYENYAAAETANISTWQSGT